MTKLRSQAGQATVMSVLFLTVLIGATAMVLDVGSWFRADRKLQADSDASALAGAQALPEDPGGAMALALDYGAKNGGAIEAGDISFESRVLPNDTIVVDSARDAPGVFTGLFGVESVEVHARAVARAGTVASAKYVAPIVVHWQHPMLQCAPPPCTGPTQLELVNLHSPGGGSGAGSFGLINLNKNGRGNAGSDEVAGWMEDGYQEYMDLGTYQSVPSTEFNNVQFTSALDLRLGTEVLFPIYKTITGSGSQAKYEIIGWVGFVPTSYDTRGNSGTLYGSFKRVIWHGLPATNPSQPSFGAYSVALVE
jgi:hypothetical protein